MTVYVRDTDFVLHCGDVLDVVRALPDGSVHCCLTSPPYWGLRDYGTGSWEGGDADCDHIDPSGGRNDAGTLADYDRKVGHAVGTVDARSERRAVGKGSTQFKSLCGKCGARRVDKQLGLEPTPEEYVANMVAVFREVRRVLRADGTCWINIGDSYAGSWSGNSMRPDGGEQRAGKPGFQAATLDERYPARAGNVPSGLKPKDLVGIPWKLAQALQEPYYTGKIRDERDRIWLAATIEAEGCLFIHKRKAGTDSGARFTRKDGSEARYERTKDTYGAGLEVSSTDRVIVERCMEIAGCGSISQQGPNENHRRKQTLYRWNLRTNECRDLMRELYPHLIAKQHEARLLIACPSSGEDACKAHESLKAIHQGLTPCIDFAPPEGMFERGWFLRSEIIWAKLYRTPCPSPSPIVLPNRTSRSSF